MLCRVLVPWSSIERNPVQPVKLRQGGVVVFTQQTQISILSFAKVNYRAGDRTARLIVEQNTMDARGAV